MIAFLGMPFRTPYFDSEVSNKFKAACYVLSEYFDAYNGRQTVFINFLQNNTDDANALELYVHCVKHCCLLLEYKASK